MMEDTRVHARHGGLLRGIDLTYLAAVDVFYGGFAK